MSMGSAVMCMMVYKVYGITAARETMCAGASVICMMVYKVYGITAARETMFAGLRSYV